MLNVPPGAKLPICPICHDPVSLESANTDEHGCAVHEDCYWAYLEQSQARDKRQAS